MSEVNQGKQYQMTYERTQVKFFYPVPIRKGKCVACERTVASNEIKVTQLHHTVYKYELSTVRANPVLAYNFTLELCYGCLPSNEKVYTNNGIKPISSVTTNDKAILNSLSDVEEIYIHDFDGVLCRIKPKYFLPIRLTPEHPVLVREVKRYAWKNRYVFLGESYFLPSDKLTKYQRDKQINLRVAIPKIIRSEKTIVKLGKKTTFETDYELGVIFGTYFADGYFLEKSRYISFDFNRKTEIVKAEEFRRILGRKGFKSSIIPKNNVISVYVCNVALGRYLKLMFGADCYSKHIPYWIFETNNAFLEGIIDGALNDGCFSPSSNSHYISTVSEELARGLQLISWKLRRPTSVSVRKPNRICIIEGRTVNEVPLFSVRWSKNPAKIVEDEKYYWVSILKVEREEYKGKVYNFSTAENIYSLPIVVHNCHPIADGFRDLLLANPRGALRPIDRIIKVGLMLPPEQQEHFTYLCRRWLKLQNGNGKE